MLRPTATLDDRTIYTRDQRITCRVRDLCLDALEFLLCAAIAAIATISLVC
jgi:hypothetical protein